MVRWGGKPQCPYCNSTRATPQSKGGRFHCNSCNTSFSVTVKTIFHKTRVPLQIWFKSVTLAIDTKQSISARQLANALGVNKNTAWLMLKRIRQTLVQDGNLLKGIYEAGKNPSPGKKPKQILIKNSVVQADHKLTEAL
ncbi:hypothetical protein A3I57_02145 [Candidatus Beckwithbacteria bacterium RIFCSPLOWO2_02_FULL_47_23]|nr:MAG: hypothetical protein A3I57_02145 [Candidatus Beckwithbacteria bacterium RIFCSPLOWO2_02_FULL_47_23]